MPHSYFLPSIKFVSEKISKTFNAVMSRIWWLTSELTWLNAHAVVWVSVTNLLDKIQESCNIVYIWTYKIQWAAVSMCNLSITVPPQPIDKRHIHGHEFGIASVPPTMRVKDVSGWIACLPHCTETIHAMSRISQLDLRKVKPKCWEIFVTYLLAYAFLTCHI